MIVAGIGCRKGVSLDQVLAAIDVALAGHGLTRDSLAALATTAFKRDEGAIFQAGAALGLRVLVVEGQAGQPADVGDPAAPVIEYASQPRGYANGVAAARPTITRSALSLAVAGAPSVSEGAALAAAGPGSRLLGPRTVLGPVTCAIAVGGEP